MDDPEPPVRIVERGLRESPLGKVLQLKVYADGYPPLGWRAIEDAFAAAYPGKWAVQFFPPADRVVDGKAVYHLFVLNEAPKGLDLKGG